MRNNIFEFIIPVALVVVLGSLVVPFGIGVGDAMVMAREGILLAGFVAFALWVWREAGADEREDYHRLLAARVAYLVGSGVLIAGILVQSVAGDVDRWLVYALLGMVIAKIGGSVWTRLRK